MRSNSISQLGAVPDIELYQGLSDTLEQLGRTVEARAWHRLVLRTDPNDPRSRAALARLNQTTEDSKK